MAPPLGPSTYDEDKDLPVYGPFIAAVPVAAGATPTKAEFDALVGKFNALVAANIAANVIAAD